MPSKVRNFAIAILVVALGAAAAITMTQEVGELDLQTVGVLVALTVALVIAATLPMHAPPGKDHHVTLEEAVLLAMLVAVPIGILPWLVLLAVTLDQVRRGASMVKMAFNVGMAGLGASGAVLTLVLVRDAAEVEDLLSLLGIAAFGVVVAAIMHLVLFAVLQSLRGEDSFRASLQLEGYLDVALVLNVLLGAIIATAIVTESWMAVVAVALIAALGNVLTEGASHHGAN